MTHSNSALQAREQHILDTAAEYIIRYGYDKMTMSDLAGLAGVTRAILYLHFDTKEALFEALLYRETQRYFQAWLEAMEKDAAGGTIAGVFRSVLAAVKSSPFLTALLKQDPQVFGRYVRQPGNLFESLRSNNLWADTLQALQSAGALRREVDPAAMGQVMSALAIGLLSIEDNPRFGPALPFDRLLETVIYLMEQALTTPQDGNPEAGKRILIEIARSARAQFEQARQAAEEGR